MAFYQEKPVNRQYALRALGVAASIPIILIMCLTAPIIAAVKRS